MFSGFFIYSLKGEVLISRLFRPDIRRGSSELFRIHIISSPSSLRSPMVTFGSTTFFYTASGNLYLALVAKQNASAAAAFELLFQFIAICKLLFGINSSSELTEELIKANFVLIYELLDEMMDFGCIVNTDLSSLRGFLTVDDIASNVLSFAKSSSSSSAVDSSALSIQATGAISWRRPDIRYKKNEVYLDVIESVNLLVGAGGNVLRSDVSGVIHVKSTLSGMPECKLGLNEKVAVAANNATPGSIDDASVSGGKNAVKAIELDDCQFHQCVRLSKFESDRVISFIPPDGEFDLMRYRTSTGNHPIFRLSPIIHEVGKSRVEFKMGIKSLFGESLFAQSVVVKIPVPLNTAEAKVIVPIGKAKYVPSENAIIWKIFRFPGKAEYVLSAEASLSPTVSKKPWSRPPISMEFQVFMFAASGLMVRFLKVFEKSGYETIKWVRYLSKAGSFQIRTT